jgi:hypothetical protein
MSKTLILTLMIAVTSTSAMAQEVIANATGQVQVGGAAPRVCRINAPTTVRAANAEFTPSSVNGGQVTIARLINPVTGVAQSSQISLTFDAVCNVAHAMTIRSTTGALSRDDGVVAGSFASRVTYSVAARWAGQSASQTFTGTPGQISMPVEDGAAGSLELDLQTTAGTAPLATGRYSDALIVELSAIS